MQNYLENKKNMQTMLLEFIDGSANLEEEHQKLINLFNDSNISMQKNELKDILLLLIRIINNHYRYPFFFKKIERIILHLRDDIQKHFTSIELFKLFQSNKRIILFLNDEKIINIDTLIVNLLVTEKYQKFCYLEYFFLEIKSLINNRMKNEIENKVKELKENNFELFKKKRNLGENDDHVCYMIRNDLIDEFISFVNQTNYPLSSTITSSIYETHSYLIRNNPTLIEYSAFFGSIQIFKYIFLNEKKFNQSLFLYAIHGDNPEIIHILEEKKFTSGYNLYKQCFIESIKCHHNEIANYIESNFLKCLSNDDDSDVFIQINEKTAAYIAIEKENDDIFQLLITNKRIKIDECAFYGCSSLKTIVIPPSVTIIGSKAFCGCSSLKTITIPSTVTFIGDYAFCFCSSLLHISIPYINAIGSGCFRECTSLTQIAIPSTVRTIGSFAFRKCTSLTKVMISSSVKIIDDFAFEGCSSLKQISIPSSVNSIGCGAFSGCNSLTNAAIPSSVYSIGSGAFEGCSSLAHISIPSSILSIVSRAIPKNTKIIKIK